MCVRSRERRRHLMMSPWVWTVHMGPATPSLLPQTKPEAWEQAAFYCCTNAYQGFTGKKQLCRLPEACRLEQLQRRHLGARVKSSGISSLDVSSLLHQVTPQCKGFSFRHLWKSSYAVDIVVLDKCGRCINQLPACHHWHQDQIVEDCKMAEGLLNDHNEWHTSV